MINKLRINGFDWEIVYDKNVTYEGNCYGSNHTDSQRIFIDPTLSNQKQMHTIIHELLHSIWWQSGLRLRYSTDEKTKGIEEEIVTALSHGLYQVLVDNKELTKELLNQNNEFEKEYKAYFTDYAARRMGCSFTTDKPGKRKNIGKGSRIPKD